MFDTVQLLEIAMLILFGCSWPFNIAKAIRSRTAKGKSIAFEIIILAGYFCGVAGKFLTYSRTGVLAYSTWFYFADIAMVATDLALCVHNRRLDRMAEN